MLVLWMLYAAAFTAIVAGAALALEQLAAIWDVPRRIVWFAALVVAVAAPVVLATRPAPAPEWITVKLRSDAAPTVAATASPVAKVAPAEPVRFHLPERFSRRWNAPIRRAWIAASVVLLALFVRGLWLVARRRSDWQPGELDGYRVLVAGDVGPAVVGALNPKIVIPAWTLSLDRAERELVLRHEAEHVAARDPLLLTAASLALVLVPWNAALWFIVRRLRLAVEIDCDARVVRDVESPRDYGMLLIAVGARHGAALPLAASLTERRPDLERRILAMTSLRPSRPLLASLPFAAVIGFAAVAVAQTPQPTPLVPAAAAPAAPAAAPVARKLRLVPTPAGEAPVAVPAKVVELIPTPAEPAEPALPATVGTPAAPVTVAVPAAAAPRNCCEVPIDTIAVWMAKYHPNVVTGGVDAEMVVFVVDNDGHYVTSRVQERRPLRVVEDNPADVEKRVAEKMAAVAKLGAVEKERVTIDDKRAMEEKAIVAEKRARELKLRDATAPSDEDKRALENKLRATGEVVVAKMKETSALEGLNVPTESIQSVNVLKMPEGRMAPGPIGIITVFLKP